MTTIIARNLRTFDSFRNKVINKKISMIPTMGALHEGHIELIRKAKEISDITIVTIFVNPKQFSNKKDLETYPSSEKNDIKILQKLKVDLIYIPMKEDIYPFDYSTYIKLEKFNDILCAARRKNHFNGVATILTKLFFLIRPDYSLFGEKDFQQLIIIRKLVKDFSINTKILAVKTIRDSNGVALSSRNLLLNALEYNKAKKINKILKKVCNKTKSKYKIDYSVSGEAFLTKPNSTTFMIQNVIKKVTKIKPKLSTTGGTSDARFIRKIAPCLEFGLVGKTMHKVDEAVSLTDLKKLSLIYSRVLKNYFK